MKKVLFIALLALSACQKDYYLEDLNKAEREISQLQAENNSLNSQITNVQANLNNLNAQLTQSNIVNTQLQNTLNSIHDDYADEIVLLESKIAIQSSNLISLTDDIDDLNDRIILLTESLSKYVEESGFIGAVDGLFEKRIEALNLERFDSVSLFGDTWLVTGYQECNNCYTFVELTTSLGGGKTVRIHLQYSDSRPHELGEIVVNGYYPGEEGQNHNWGWTRFYPALYDFQSELESDIEAQVIRIKNYLEDLN